MDVFDRLKAATADDWQSYVDHDFVRQMGAGTLPQAAFRTYLVQDYLFLIQFARAYALATYKSRTLADMKAAQAGVAAILDEMDLHVRLCGRWGLSPQDIEAAPEHQATIAYTRFVLDCGAAGDLLDLHVRLPDRARHDLGRDAMDGLAARLPAAARAALVRAAGFRSTIRPPSSGGGTSTTPMRRDLRGGRLYRGVGRLHLDRRRHRHVGLAGARGQERRDLRLGALGDDARGERRRAARPDGVVLGKLARLSAP
jgi:hypothetical protein